MMRKALAMFLSLVFIVTALVGCAPSQTTAQPAQPNATSVNNPTTNAASSEEAVVKDVVKIGVTPDWQDISPFGPMVSSTRAYIMYNFYEHLLVRSKFGAPLDQMERQVAKEIKKIDDLTYQVKMYDYVTDSAGNKITAQDYVWSATTMRDKGNYEKLNSYLKDVVALDDYTVEIKLTENALGAIEYILDLVPVISKKAFEASGDEMATKPIATGPYMVESMVPGSTLVLVANKNYWQTDKAARSSLAAQNVNKVVYSVIAEPLQMAIALQSGNIDLAQFMDNSVMEQFYPNNKAVDGFDVFPVSSNIMFSLLPNMSASDSIVATDLALREAIYYAIDNSAIVKGTLNGLGTPLKAMANPISGDYVAAWDKRDYFDYNVEKAKEKLAASNYKGETLRFMTLVGFEKPVQIIIAELDAVGIKAEMHAYEGALYSNYKLDPTQWDLMFDIKGTDDYVTFPWSLLFNADSFGGKTANFIVDDELQTAIKAANNAATHSDQTVDVVQQTLDKNAYAYGLFTRNNYIVAKSGIVDQMAYFRGTCVLPGATTYVK